MYYKKFILRNRGNKTVKLRKQSNVIKKKSKPMRDIGRSGECHVIKSVLNLFYSHHYLIFKILSYKFIIFQHINYMRSGLEAISFSVEKDNGSREHYGILVPAFEANRFLIILFYKTFVVPIELIIDLFVHVTFSLLLTVFLVCFGKDLPRLCAVYIFFSFFFGLKKERLVSQKLLLIHSVTKKYMHPEEIEPQSRNSARK